MAFKPLTKNNSSTALTETKTPEQEAHEKSLNARSTTEIIATTEERIQIIFDDSGSMGSKVEDKTCIELAQEATIDYMKNCKPHVSAVEIAPINVELIPLSKNLPQVASDIKKIEATGGTKLYMMLEKLVNTQPIKKFTRALIFTDGQATDHPEENLINRVLEMKIPIDLIIIGDRIETSLWGEEITLKNMVETSGGVFMICKDGKAFKEKK